ncbi:MAG: hypothetical protein HOW73_06955 [Polyangiaceae bacterium]|nr:hypothetical protein [Polyangiaceae bacterium]
MTSRVGQATSSGARQAGAAPARLGSPEANAGKQRRTTAAFAVLAALAAFAAASCGDDSQPPPTEEEGTTFLFDLAADLHDPAKFFDVPYPSDLRLDAGGHPDLAGFPNPQAVGNVTGLVTGAKERTGFPVLPVAYLRFDAPLAARVETDVIAADVGSPILLVDIDADSNDKGALVPVVAKTLEADPYTSENVLAVAARPGFILRPGTTYAVVVMKSANDAENKPLGKSAILERLRTNAPGAGEEAAAELYAPLWPTLDVLGISAEDVAAATVFTTGRVVEETAALGDAVLDKYDVTIENLAFDADELYPELCVLRGTVKLPQFQQGTPPYDENGLFQMGDDGLPVERAMEEAPVAIVIPRTPMPDAGYPLVLNVHGSGGYSIAMVRPVGDDGVPGDPIGPAFPYATKRLAMAGFAMPLNPERFSGAEETAYLNVNNLVAMRDTFRQGILEARLFVEALTKLQIQPALLEGCIGTSLPEGATSFFFDANQLVITGQSMGGMYTNLIGATEPLLRAAVPTGAGGHWTYFILETSLREGQIPAFLTLLLGTTTELTHLHPVLSIGAAALEPADPIIYMPHLARRPLEGHPTRPIYEPVGRGDSYFPTTIYDAVALAYGHQQAGDQVWPEMQEALALEGRDGLLTFPVTDNITSEAEAPYTGVVVQYEADGDYDPHAIYSHRDDVKRQYACFIDTFLRDGSATVVEPTSNWEEPCP